MNKYIGNLIVIHQPLKMQDSYLEVVWYIHSEPKN